MTWIDVTGLAALGGIGFTVSLLIAELSFEPEDPMYSTAKAAVLAGSVLASGVGGAVLWARSSTTGAAPWLPAPWPRSASRPARTLRARPPE